METVKEQGFCGETGTGEVSLALVPIVIMCQPMHRKTLSFLILLTICMMHLSCFKSLTVTNIVYENDFESGDAKGFVSGPKGLVGTYNGSKVLGPVINTGIDLVVHNLPAHQLLRVEFDLNIHNNWANDLWEMKLDGNYQWITGFSNNPSVQQSYPQWLNNGLSPAGANSQTSSLPGLCGHGNTSMYRMISTLSHTDSTFSLQFGDAGSGQSDTCSRSWSVDNVRISVFRN